MQCANIRGIIYTYIHRSVSNFTNQSYISQYQISYNAFIMSVRILLRAAVCNIPPTNVYTERNARVCTCIPTGRP